MTALGEGPEVVKWALRFDYFFTGKMGFEAPSLLLGMGFGQALGCETRIRAEYGLGKWYLYQIFSQITLFLYLIEMTNPAGYGSTKLLKKNQDSVMASLRSWRYWRQQDRQLRRS